MAALPLSTDAVVRDYADLRSVLADNLWAQYGNADPVVGGDAVARWVTEAIGGWRISRLVLAILWAEDKTDPTGYLALIGGRGPQG
jgi:hypothetical protein